MLLLLLSGIVMMKEHIRVLDWLKAWAPVRYVRVGGVFQHISKDDVKQTLQPVLDVDFITADLQEIRSAVVSLPWVADAKVKREWPDAIDIKVFEQHPFKRWGEKSLLNEQGDIFTLQDTGAYHDMALLICPRGQQRRFLEIMKGIEVALSDRSLELVEFRVTERLSWELILSNGLRIKLGKKQPLYNVQRFLKSTEILGVERMNAMAMIDMRYPNGFAVTWKPGVNFDWETNDGSAV